MNKTDLEVFKQALTEGLAIKFERELAECPEIVICSDSHYRRMNRIINKEYVFNLNFINQKTKAASILIAATLVFAGCTNAYKNEIRDFIETVYEGYTDIKFSDDKATAIITPYELGYVPKGYEVANYLKNDTMIYYLFVDSNNNMISFFQLPIGGTSFGFDTEQGGYSEYLYVANNKIYHRKNTACHCYVWNDGIYALSLESDLELSCEELEMIISGLKIKE